MKVMKFGGSSVGTATSIQNVKKIVEGESKPVIVVVSALGGVTDSLIDLSRRAAAGDKTYRASADELRTRHRNMVADVIPADRQDELGQQLERLFDELRSILHGVFLIQDLTPKTTDAIVAYGERLSSLIVSRLLDGATHIDSRNLVKTVRQGEKHIVDFEATNRLVRETLTAVQGTDRKSVV